MTHAVQTQPSRPRTVILISGRGSNMRVIVELAQRGELPIEVCAVVSDKATAGGLDIAASLGVPTRVLTAAPFADRESYDAALTALVASFEPSLIVLAGFMRILTPRFIAAFRGKILNIHPSLLPKYRGLHTHRRALEARECEHGVSVHFVTEELDGGPVIIQACIDVRPQDTVESLSARVQQQEHKIYPQAIRWFAERRLEWRDAAAWLDGKRLCAPVIVDAKGA